MKAFKILLKEEKTENKWGVDIKGQARLGKVAFDYKNEDVSLKKGDMIYFVGDYAKEINLDGQLYTSINPTDLICQK